MIANRSMTTMINDNETSAIIVDWQAHYSFWVDGVITLILVIVGVVGNVSMVISLVCSGKRWLPLYYYFFAFSLWNTALLASTMFFYCIPALDQRQGAKNAEFTYVNLLGYLLANAGMTAAIWLVLGVTVERCIVVSRPLHQIVSEPKRRAKYVTAIISILAPLFNIPLFFELRVVNNGSDLEKSALREHPAYKIGYRIVGNMLFLSVVPFLSIIAMSLRIIYLVQNTMASRSANDSKRNSKTMTLRKSSSNNQKMKTSLTPESNNHVHHHRISSSAPSCDDPSDSYVSPISRCHSLMVNKNQYATHMTLALLASKFVVAYSLPTVLNILEIIVEPSTLQREGLGFLVDLSNLMVVADSVLNAFCYMSWRRKIQVQQNKSKRRQKTSKCSANGSAKGAKNGAKKEAKNGACLVVANGVSPGVTAAAGKPLIAGKMAEHRL